MRKGNKCVNLILNNANAVYVYTVLKIFKEIEIPEGHEVKNKNINNLMNRIFKSDSVAKVSKRGEKEEPQKHEGYKSLKKIDINPKAASNDWHQSNLFSWVQVLASVFAFNKFIKNESYQSHNKDCMQKLAELSRENPDWEEKYKLENLKWSEIANVTKAMWRKYHNESDGHKKYEMFQSLSKTFTITIYIKNILDELGNKIFYIFLLTLFC